MNDIIAFMSGKIKELVEMTEKVLKKLNREVEEKGLKLTITEGEKKERTKLSLPADISTFFHLLGNKK